MLVVRKCGYFSEVTHAVEFCLNKHAEETFPQSASQKKKETKTEAYLAFSLK